MTVNDRKKKRRRSGPRPSRPPAPEQDARGRSRRAGGADRGSAARRASSVQPETETPKLHKVLAQAGLGSRRWAEQAIAEGRVSVNGKLAHVGQRVAEGDRLRVDGHQVAWQAQLRRMRVLLYHKPVGELVTRSDPQNRPTVFQRLPRLKQGKWQAVGRLDLNTEGLLVLTDSGWLANRMMHPRFGLEREYAVRVLGGLTPEEQRRLLDGVRLDDGEARFSALSEATAGDGVNRWYRAVIAEGRNREVRRMIEAVDHAVSRLIRVRYGPIALPRSLRRGKWMELDAARVAELLAHIEALGEPPAGDLPEAAQDMPPEPQPPAAGRAQPRRGVGGRPAAAAPRRRQRPERDGGRPARGRGSAPGRGPRPAAAPGAGPRGRRARQRPAGQGRTR